MCCCCDVLRRAHIKKRTFCGWHGKCFISRGRICRGNGGMRDAVYLGNDVCRIHTDRGHHWLPAWQGGGIIMQFYIIHKDPETNAKLLPEYALKRVNIREGWSIVSDIGHRFGVTWDGQNKLYNAHHPLTRSFAHLYAFGKFCLHYEACLAAYIERGIGGRTVWHDAFEAAPLRAIAGELPADAFGEVRHYLLTAKRDKLTDGEIATMEEE